VPDAPQALRTERLCSVSRLDLAHDLSGITVPSVPPDPMAESFPFSHSATEVPDVNRLTERQYPDPEGRVDGWARRFVGGQGRVGTQLPAEMLAPGCGSCRDFARLMMEAARSLGLAARFVTGYLYEAGVVEQQGGGASHAWCAICLPGAGWVEYDRANGLPAGANLIRVGVSRAPEQALPVSGGHVGDPNDPVGMQVCLEVLPLAEDKLAQAA